MPTREWQAIAVTLVPDFGLKTTSGVLKLVGRNPDIVAVAVTLTAVH
jgi:hypothetical protein